MTLYQGQKTKAQRGTVYQLLNVQKLLKTAGQSREQQSEMFVLHLVSGTDN